MPRSTHLCAASDASDASDDWRAAALADLSDKLDDRTFPCIFARNAHRKRIVETIFVENTDDAGLDALARDLRTFVERCRDWDGRLETAPPLVVLFHPRCHAATDVDAYHRFGWHVLVELHRRDTQPWPDAVPQDPDDPLWSMCFTGMALFVNMSTPAHHRRRSRNLGDCFTFVINPRERFDVVAGDTPRGRRTRRIIRSRILDYDGIPASADLATYGDGAPEWMQYELKDGDTGHGSCPFTAATQDRGGQNAA